MPSHTIRREHVGKCSFEDYLRVYIHTKEHSRPQYPILPGSPGTPDPDPDPPKTGRKTLVNQKTTKKRQKNP